jgi:hypothetical protein
VEERWSGETEGIPVAKAITKIATVEDESIFSRLDEISSNLVPTKSAAPAD